MLKERKSIGFGNGNERSSRKVFTLIELLIVIAIIAILAAMLMPALNKARDQARAISCTGNLKSIAGAAGHYAEDYYDFIAVKGSQNDWDLGFWAYLLSPYLGFKTNYSKFTWKTEWSTANWAKLFKNGTILTCPSRRLVTSKAKYRIVVDKGITYAFNDENHGGFSYGGAFTGTTGVGKFPAKTWSRYKEIRGKSPSNQLIIGDNRDTGAYNSDSPSSRFAMIHNPVSGSSPSGSERHNGTGNYSWADGHVTSKMRPKALWGITKAPWVYSKTRYMYYFSVTPL
ncbi:MAG: DUF1559 domain-containing protein [Lentisphaeria bacterium]|nr:DUF1559 domain-containing protein [Lentisphaeria bacterium]